jgi:hypothetical protein
MKKKTQSADLRTAITCLVLITIIIALGASPIGWTVTKETVQSVKLSDVLVVREEGQPDYGQGPGIPIHTVTIKSTFMPRQYELPQASACLYNSELKAASYADVRWDVLDKASSLGINGNAVSVFRETKTATLKLYQQIKYTGRESIPAKPVPVGQEAETYDQLLLFIEDTGTGYPAYTDCYNIQPEELEKAIRITITP